MSFFLSPRLEILNFPVATRVCNLRGYSITGTSNKVSYSSKTQNKKKLFLRKKREKKSSHQY